MRLIRRSINYGGADQAQFGKAGSKDPRFVQVTNDPRFQADIAQFAKLRQILDAAPIPQISGRAAGFSANAATSAVQTEPTRVEFLTWGNNVPDQFVPMLICPKNLSRMGLILFNGYEPGSFAGRDLVYYSFGFPVISGVGSAPAGFPVAAGTSLVFDAGIIPTNDVYGWTNHAGMASIGVFEAVRAPEANPS